MRDVIFRDMGNDLVTSDLPSFDISLANGQRWRLVASEATAGWLGRFARVMGLPAADHAEADVVRMIFATENKEDERSRQVTMLNGMPLSDSLTRRPVRRNLDLIAMRVLTLGESRDVVCLLGEEQSAESEVVRMWLALQPIYHRAAVVGGIPLHAGMLVKEGEAFLLAAPGASGKSTCCNRAPAPWRSPCDDELLVVRDGQGRFVAHPFPTWSDLLWRNSDRIWATGGSYPVAGVFFLRQAAVDSAVPLGKAEAAMLLSGSANQVLAKSLQYMKVNDSRVLKRRIFENACELAKSVPTFLLDVTVSGRFWEEMERVLCRDRGAETATIHEARIGDRDAPYHEIAKR